MLTISEDSGKGPETYAESMQLVRKIHRRMGLAKKNELAIVQASICTYARNTGKRIIEGLLTRVSELSKCPGPLISIPLGAPDADELTVFL